MVHLNNIANYYKNTTPQHHEFFKAIFERIIKIEDLEEEVSRKSKLDSQWRWFDSVFLFEAITFLRLSMFNLLSYKHLICGKHLPMSKVALYYSYFYSINCLLRLRGKALIHVRGIPEQILDDVPPKQVTFQLIQHENHTFSLDTFGKNEHEFVWNDFYCLFQNLSHKDTGRFFTQDRYDWNYGLLYPSQATDEFTQHEIEARCNENFLDPQFENVENEGLAEYRHDLIANYGYEEAYAGDLIKKGLEILVIIGKESNHKLKYLELLTKIRNDIDKVKSSENTKNEIKRWLDDSIIKINQSK